MTDTFNSDKENQGTTEEVKTETVDNTSENSFSSGNVDQQQLNTMQKRLADKDDHINNIQGENQILREKLASIEERLANMATVEDALTKLKEQQNSQGTALDEDTLKSIIRNEVPTAMQELTAEQKAAQNFSTVSAKLTEKYGADKVDAEVKAIAASNGITYDDMIALSKKSPKLVLKMAGLDQQQTTASVTQSTVVDRDSANTTKEQKLAYYSKLRRENPKEYYKPEVQKQFRLACLSKD